MVNAKAQMEFLLRLNKIVIFGNDYNHHSRNSLIASSTPINANNSTTIADYLNLNNKHSNETISIQTVSSLTKTGDDYVDIDLKRSQNSINDRLSKLNNHPNSTKKIELNTLLELYGVASKYITYIYMNKLNNSSECESYIRKKFCFNQELIYPIIFINGIYFGSDKEINYAHNEGILFELLNNVGLFETNNPHIVNNNTSDNQSLSKNFNKINNKKQLSLKSDDQDLAAIDRVAKFNNLVPIQQSSNISVRLHDFDEEIEDKDEDDEDDLNSVNSSISSIDKNLMCENFVKHNNPINLKEKNKILDKKLILQPIKKEVSFSCHKQKNSNFFKSSDMINKMQNKNNHNVKHNMKNLKTTTPPAEVLATINKWLRETKKVIETRNKDIIRKKNYS